jgi:hypothetical protein
VPANCNFVHGRCAPALPSLVLLACLPGCHPGQRGPVRHPVRAAAGAAGPPALRLHHRPGLVARRPHAGRVLAGLLLQVGMPVQGHPLGWSPSSWRRGACYKVETSHHCARAQMEQARPATGCLHVLAA